MHRYDLLQYDEDHLLSFYLLPKVCHDILQSVLSLVECLVQVELQLMRELHRLGHLELR